MIRISSFRFLDIRYKYIQRKRNCYGMATHTEWFIAGANRSLTSQWLLFLVVLNLVWFFRIFKIFNQKNVTSQWGGNKRSPSWGAHNPPLLYFLTLKSSCWHDIKKIPTFIAFFKLFLGDLKWRFCYFHGPFWWFFGYTHHLANHWQPHFFGKKVLRWYISHVSFTYIWLIVTDFSIGKCFRTCRKQM